MLLVDVERSAQDRTTSVATWSIRIAHCTAFPASAGVTDDAWYWAAGFIRRRRENVWVSAVPRRSSPMRCSPSAARTSSADGDRSRISHEFPYQRLTWLGRPALDLCPHPGPELLTQRGQGRDSVRRDVAAVQRVQMSGSCRLPSHDAGLGERLQDRGHLPLGANTSFKGRDQGLRRRSPRRGGCRTGRLP